MRPPPSEEKAPRPAKSRREADKSSIEPYGSRPPLASAGEPAPSKALIANDQGVWLFAVRTGHHVEYSVELADHVWRFTLLYSAESKFLREVNKASNGGGQP